MAGLVDSLVRRAVRKGLRQGLAQGSAGWVALGAAAWLLRFVLRPEPAKVTREDLRLGETLVVRHLPAPPTRRERRKAERRAGRAVLAARAAEDAADARRVAGVDDVLA